MEIKDIEDRKEKRRVVLQQAYDYYFEGHYNGYPVTLDLTDEFDLAIYLAMKYLDGKGLVRISSDRGDGKFNLEITSDGIDTVEKNDEHSVN